MSGRIKHQDIFVALHKTGLTQHFEYRSPIEYDSSRRLEQFVEIIAAKAAAAEREACAKIVEQYCGAWDDAGYALSQAVRARGQE